MEDHSTNTAIIANVIVVGFHHQHGPIVEFAYPPFPGQKQTDSLDQVETPEEWSFLPFLALPDGAHLSDEDFTYFHLPPVKDNPDIQGTLFGISCNRQIAASELVNKTADITRSTVQKAIVVLARQPVFGPIKEKLGVVTKAYFNQKDFENTDILVGFHQSLSNSIQGNISDMTFYMGTSLRELVHKFKLKTLVLLKLLLLERKIMFFGHPVERLCTYQYSLISLIPDLLKKLEDTGAPELCAREQSVLKATSLKTSDRQSLMSYLGLPLNVFEQGCFFQPYLPLQQIDIIQDKDTKSFLVGVTNSIFFEHKGCDIDVLVNVEDGSIKFYNNTLTHVSHLSSADRKWMDEIVNIVNMSWNEADPTRPITMGYAGSDDFLRAKFEDYIVSLLASVKHADYVATRGVRTDPGGGILMSKAEVKSSLADFNPPFVTAWRQTSNFAQWYKLADSEIFDIVEPRHPTAGRSSTIEDVQIRLTHGIQDLRLEENLQPAREAIGKAFTSGTTKAKSAMDSFFKEIETMREQDRLRRLETKAENGGEVSTSTSTERRPGLDANGDRPVSWIGNMEDTQAKVSTTLSSWGSYLVTKRNEIMNRSPSGTPRVTPASTPRQSTDQELKPFELNPAKLNSTPTPKESKRRSLSMFGHSRSPSNGSSRGLRVASSDERPGSSRSRTPSPRLPSPGIEEQQQQQPPPPPPQSAD